MLYKSILVYLTFVSLIITFGHLGLSYAMKVELTTYSQLPIIYGQGDAADIPETDPVDTTNLDTNDQSFQQEDKMIVSSNNATPLQNSTSETSGGIDNYWESILSVVITVGGATIVYFTARYFLQRTADSLHLERRELKGVYSVVKLILIVISITIIVFQFSSISGVAAGAISVAAGTIIGFSSRNTISNAIAGILLLSARPFKLGDRIRTTEDEDLIGDVVDW